MIRILTDKLDNLSDFLFAYRFKGKKDHWKRFCAFQKDFFLGGLLPVAKGAKPKAQDHEDHAHEDIGFKLVSLIVGASTAALGFAFLFAPDNPPYTYKQNDTQYDVFPQSKQVLSTSVDKTFLLADFSTSTLCKGVLVQGQDKDSQVAVTGVCDAFSKASTPSEKAHIEIMRAHLQTGTARMLKNQQK